MNLNDDANSEQKISDHFVDVNKMVDLNNNILPAFLAFNSKEQCVKLAIELPCPSG
jgi:hypothetical protein